MRVVAVKFCGCCNPTYDRSEYWQQVQSAARGVITWVGLDSGNFDKVLVLSGCQTACLMEQLTVGQSVSVVSVNDGTPEPQEVVQLLLE